MQHSANDIRKRVSTSYSRALVEAEGIIQACCSPGSCKSGTEATDVIPSVPSFGCGDPLLFSNVAAGSTVLDLGSGAGFDLIAAAERVGPDGTVVGVDMTDDMVDASRLNVAAAGYANVEIRKGLIEDLPVEASSVDWVISNCVINLSPEKDRVFAEIARVLKPGGRFSISDICASDLPDWIRSSAAAYDGCIAGAVSEKAYVHGLRRAGFREIMIDSRVVYDEHHLRALAEELLGPAPSNLHRDYSTLQGKVWSVRFTGRKPV